MNTRLIAGAAPATAMLVAAFVACNGQTLDLGGDEADGGTTSMSPPLTIPEDAGATQVDDGSTPPPDPDDATTGADEPFDGAVLQLPLLPATDAGDPTARDEEIWTGYVENYKFEYSSSDSVRLSFTANDGGALTGHVILGALPLFPPVTDPNVGYPFADASADGLTSTDLDVYEGFAFTLYNASLVNDRLQAGFDLREMQGQWCSYQRSFLFAPGNPPLYNCLPNANTMGTTDSCIVDLDLSGGPYPVNCDRWTFCGGLQVCSCDASACGPNVQTTDPPYTFDLQVNGGNADGTLALNPAMMLTVHLTRQ